MFVQETKFLMLEFGKRTRKGAKRTDERQDQNPSLNSELPPSSGTTNNKPALLETQASHRWRFGDNPPRNPLPDFQRLATVDVIRLVKVSYHRPPPHLEKSPLLCDASRSYDAIQASHQLCIDGITTGPSWEVLGTCHERAGSS